MKKIIVVENCKTCPHRRWISQLFCGDVFGHFECRLIHVKHDLDENRSENFPTICPLENYNKK